MWGKIYNRLSWPKIAIWATAIITLIAVITGGYLYINRDTNPIPRQLRSQLTFSPFVIPVDSKDFLTSNYKFSTAEGKVQILSFLIKYQNNTVSVSEYSQPPQFTDIPEYKNQFLTNVINQYSSVSTASGTIYLGKAVKQNNKQLALMIERGLLVFLSPDKKLTDAQWRSLGDQLEIQKTDN